jgi:hypothetical protein
MLIKSDDELSLYCVMRRFAVQSHVVVREALKLRRLTSPNLRANVRECVTPSKVIGDNHLHTGANQIQCHPPCTFLILAILGVLSAGCLHFSYHWIPVESTPTLLWQLHDKLLSGHPFAFVSPHAQ